MPQIIGPLIGIIGKAILGGLTGAGGLFAGLGAIGKAILGTLISAGLNLLAGLLTKNKQKDNRGFSTQVQVGGDIPRQVVLGIKSEAGHLAYWNTYGSNNKFLQLCYVLSDSYCDSLTGEVIYNGEKRQMTSRTPTGNAHAEYTINDTEEKIVVRFFNGSQTDADTELVTNANPVERWTSNDKFTGMCYVSLTIEFDDDLFTAIPQCQFTLKGSRLFDPRKAAALGGTGSHVWGDQATYEFSECPALMLYNFLLGIRNFQGEHMVGLMAPFGAIDTNLFVTAMNVCDEAVALEAGGTEARFRASLNLTANSEVRGDVEKMANAMGGYTVERAGLFGVIAAASQTPVATITDGDLMVGSTVRWNKKRSRSQLANRVFGQFLDPANIWQPNSYPPITPIEYETEDGEPLGVTLDMPAVTSVTQAQRLAKLRLLELRRQGRATLVLGFQWVWLQSGDWIIWDSAKTGTLTWRIVRRELDPRNRAVKIEIDEIHEDVYGWSSGEEGEYHPPVPGDNDNLIQTVANWNVEVAGEGMPSLRFSWTPPNDPTINAVLIQYRPVGQVDVTNRTDMSPDDGVDVATGVEPLTVYEARATIDTTPRRPTVWTAWKRAGATEENPDGDPTNPIPGDFVEGIPITSISQEFRDILDDGSLTIAEMREEFEVKIADLSEYPVTHLVDILQTIDLIKIAKENSFSAILQEETLRVTETTALFESTEAIQTLVEDPDTGLVATAGRVDEIDQSVSIIDGEVNVLSSQQTTISAIVNNPVTGNVALGSSVSGQAARITANENAINVVVDDFDEVDARVTNAEGQILANATATDAQRARVDILNRAITGALVSATGTSVVLPTAAVAGIPNNGLIGLTLAITSGAGAGQTKTITNYVASTRVVTFTPAFTTIPVAGDTFAIGTGPVALSQAERIGAVQSQSAGNNALLLTHDTSINGLFLRHGVVGDINGSTGGYYFTGIQRLDGSVVYDFVISANNLTLGNFQNYIRNFRFDANGAAVIPATAANSIRRWYINSSIGSVSVVTAAAAPAGCPTPYALALARTGQPLIYSDYSPALTGAQDKGFPVVAGQKFLVSTRNAATGSSLSDGVKIVILKPDGTTADALVKGQASANTTWQRIFSTTWAQYEQEFEIPTGVNGRAFLRFQPNAGGGTIYYTDVYVVEKNGAKLIVSGGILSDMVGTNQLYTHHINLDGIEAEGLAIGAASIPKYATSGTDVIPTSESAWKQVLSLSYTGNPSNPTLGDIDVNCKVVCFGNFNLNFSGGPIDLLWEVRILADGVEIDRNGGANPDAGSMLMGAVDRNAGQSVTFTAEIRGNPSLMTLDGISLYTSCVKRTS